MIPETALAIAGDDARLVARPAGVAHVYTGPLTPSGRFVPRSARTVCRARTRQLHPLPLQVERTSLTCGAAATRRLCRRCTACLARDRDRTRQATTPPSSRHDWIREYSGTTKADVAFALELATTPPEVDTAAWLSLLLFDVDGCNAAFEDRGLTWPSLHQLVCTARGRVGGYPESLREAGRRSLEQSMFAHDARVREARGLRAEREERIRRVGINIAQPEPRRSRRP